MTEPTELLPCPFCGAAAHFEMDEGRWEWVECESCGMQGNRSASLMEDCKPKLTEEWNRRTPQPTQAQAGAVPVEFLRGVIALCTQRGYSPENIEAWSKDDKWVADLWRQAEQMLAIAKWGTPAPVGVEPVAKFDNPMVQAVYAILCEDASPPSGEHWEGFVARRIVDQVLAMGRVPPETCEWTATDAFDQTYWDSACGEAWTFIDGDPADNSVRFCQGCGKPVHIKQGGQHGTE